MVSQRIEQGMGCKLYIISVKILIDLFIDQTKKTIQMPVPASYNDITEDGALRDHVGTVWYDRKFFIPGSWSDNKRVWIRFGSVHYEAHVVSS